MARNAGLMAVEAVAGNVGLVKDATGVSAVHLIVMAGSVVMMVVVGVVVSVTAIITGPVILTVNVITIMVQLNIHGLLDVLIVSVRSAYVNVTRIVVIKSGILCV